MKCLKYDIVKGYCLKARETGYECRCKVEGDAKSCKSSEVRKIEKVFCIKKVECALFNEEVCWEDKGLKLIGCECVQTM